MGLHRAGRALRKRARRIDPRLWTATDRLFALTILAILISPAWAASQAIGHGWAPHGDDATVALRAADVLNGHFPLSGMRSTSGVSDGSLSSHHPGPLQFYLLAFPLALAGGSSAGIVIGGALIAAAASICTVVWARRIGGGLGLVVFTAGLLLAQWAIGPEAMFRPLNPFAPLVPTYLALLLLVALAQGDRRALPPFVVAVSFIAQGNLAFLPLATILTGTGLLLVMRGRSPRRRRRTRATRRLHRSALGLGVLIWLPSIVELLVHQPNNLTQVIKWSASDTGNPIGIVAALEHLSLLAPLPGGYRRYSAELLSQGNTFAMVVGIAVVVVLALISSGWHAPHGRASSAWPARIALAANLGMLITASRLPDFPAAPYWIVTWIPVAAFTWAALAWRALAYLERAALDLNPRWAFTLTAGLTVGGLVASTCSLQPQWAEFDSMAAVGRTAADKLGPGEGRPLQITGQGFDASLGATPSVAWHAHRAGWEPHYLPSWPFPEGAEHLWTTTSPQEGSHLYITDSTVTEVEDGVPATAQFLGSVTLSHRAGQMMIYVDPPVAPRH